MGIEFDPKSIKNWEKRTNKALQKITKELSDPEQFRDIQENAKQGLRDNEGLNYQNSKRYQEVKETLKSRGVIVEDKPLQVTGQLINDLSYKILQKSPDEIQSALSFDHTKRIRPSLTGMFKVYSGSGQLDTQSEKSSEVAQILISKKGIPIVDSLANLYSKDFTRRVEEIINDALKKA